MKSHAPTSAAPARSTVAAGHDVTLRVAGKPFRCACGCNVFQHPEGEPDVFRCNACAAEYEATN